MASHLPKCPSSQTAATKAASGKAHWTLGSNSWWGPCLASEQRAGGPGWELISFGLGKSKTQAPGLS